MFGSECSNQTTSNSSSSNGKSRGVDVLKGDLVGQLHSLSKERRCPAILFDNIDSNDIATVLGSEGAGRTTDPTPDVEDARVGFDLCKVGDFSGGLEPADVELVERRDILPRERVDVFPGGFEGASRMSSPRSVTP